MGPTGRLFHIRQGDLSIEDYASDFVAEARQSSLEETCLTIFFWGGLAEPFKSGMPYWHPGESLEGYVNRALYLKGSSFRVEEAAMPSHTASKVVASAHASPEAAVPAHIPLEVAVTAHRASCPFLGHPRLITSVQDPPLMLVQVALSARVLSKEVVPAHKALEAVEPADMSSEVAVLASDLFKAGEPADVSYEVTGFASGPLEMVEPTDASPEVVELASGPIEAVEPADVSSEVAELALGLLKAVEPADVSSEVAELALGLLKAVEPVDVSSEVAEQASGLLEAVEPANISSEVAELTSDPFEVVEHADVSSEVAELASCLLEAVEHADVSSEVVELASCPLEVVEPTDVSSEAVELTLGLLEAVEPTDVSSEIAASAHTAHEAPDAHPHSSRRGGVRSRSGDAHPHSSRSGGVCPQSSRSGGVCPQSSRSSPGAHAVHSRARSSPEAYAVCSGLGAHRVSPALPSCPAGPTLVPVAASVSRPPPTTWAWPPHPSPDSAPARQFPLSDARKRLEAIPLRGVVSGVQARRPPFHHQRSPSPFLLDSFILTPHTCAPTHHIPSCSPSSRTTYTTHSRHSACCYQTFMHVCVCTGWSGFLLLRVHSVFVYCLVFLPVGIFVL